MAIKDITLEIVKKWFTYDKESGNLTLPHKENNESNRTIHSG